MTRATLARKLFKIVARVRSANLSAIKPALKEIVPEDSIVTEGDELAVEAEVAGESARELNRLLLSSLRRIEKRTTLRAEWTSPNGVKERYFDYVLKKTTRA